MAASRVFTATVRWTVGVDWVLLGVIEAVLRTTASTEGTVGFVVTVHDADGEVKVGSFAEARAEVDHSAIQWIDAFFHSEGPASAYITVWPARSGSLTSMLTFKGDIESEVLGFQATLSRRVARIGGRVVPNDDGSIDLVMPDSPARVVSPPLPVAPVTAPIPTVPDDDAPQAPSPSDVVTAARISVPQPPPPLTPSDQRASSPTYFGRLMNQPLIANVIGGLIVVVLLALAVYFTTHR